MLLIREIYRQTALELRSGLDFRVRHCGIALGSSGSTLPFHRTYVSDFLNVVSCTQGLSVGIGTPKLPDSGSQRYAALAEHLATIEQLLLQSTLTLGMRVVSLYGPAEERSC